MALIKLRKNKVMCEIVKGDVVIATVEVSIMNPHNNCYMTILADESLVIRRKKLDENETLPVLHESGNN